MTQKEYVQSQGIEYVEGDSFEEIPISQIQENLFDIAIRNVSVSTFDELNTSKRKVTFTIDLENISEPIYDYLLKIRTQNSILVEKINIFPENASFIREFELNTSLFLGISILPKYNFFESNLENNFYIHGGSLFGDLAEENISINRNAFWNYSYDNISYTFPLNLSYNWGKNSILNISKNNLEINFTNQNNLEGDYIFILKADDGASFFINNNLLFRTEKRNKQYVSNPVYLDGFQDFTLNYWEKKGNAKLFFDFGRVCSNYLGVVSSWSFVSCNNKTNILLENYYLNSNSSELIFDLGNSLKYSTYPKRDMMFSRKSFYEKGEYYIKFESQNNAKLYIDGIFYNTSRNLRSSWEKIDGLRYKVYPLVNLSEGMHTFEIVLPSKGGRKYVYFDITYKDNTILNLEPYSFKINIDRDLANLMSEYPQTNWNELAKLSFRNFLNNK